MSLRAAAIDLVDIWDIDTCYDTGRHLTHAEVVVLAAVFVATGRTAKADLLLIGSLAADVEDRELTREEADEQLMTLRTEAGVEGAPGLKLMDAPWWT